jgi:hypothetical protein
MLFLFIWAEYLIDFIEKCFFDVKSLFIDFLKMPEKAEQTLSKKSLSDQITSFSISVGDCMNLMDAISFRLVFHESRSQTLLFFVFPNEIRDPNGIG